MGVTVDIVDLESVVSEQLALALEQPAGRSAVTLLGGRDHDLRQTLIAIAAGSRLHEHDSPSEASLQVLRGDVAFTIGDREHVMRTGDYMVIPPDRHDLTAL